MFIEFHIKYTHWVLFAIGKKNYKICIKFQGKKTSILSLYRRDFMFEAMMATATAAAVAMTAIESLLRSVQSTATQRNLYEPIGSIDVNYYCFDCIIQ